MAGSWTAVVALGLAARRAPGAPPAAVTVEGNRFYRDGAPWVAEGVTLVGLVSPERRGRARRADLRRGAGRASGPACSTRSGATAPTPCASRSARPGSTRSRRPTIPATATTCSRRSPLTRAAGLNVIVSMQWQGAAGPRRRRPADGDDPARLARDRRRPSASDRGILLELFNEPALQPRTAARLEALAESTAGADRRCCAGRGARTCCWSAGCATRGPSTAPRRSTTRSGQLGYAVHPYLGQHNQTRAAVGREVRRLRARPIR